MIIAFLSGGGIAFFPFNKTPSIKKVRQRIYQWVVFYLLIKIGFNGGLALVGQAGNQVLMSASVVVTLSVVWTFMVLGLLTVTKSFNHLTRLSIATHFGSVSVGTFVAGITFIEAMGYSITAPVSVWLALMELPALIVGMFVLRVPWQSAFSLIFKDRTLFVLIGAIVFGYFFGAFVPTPVTEIAFKVIFTPILLYFMFEMGTKAQASWPLIKQHYKPFLTWGILLPLFGAGLGIIVTSNLGWSLGEAFIFTILMASASYVLVPITLPEILKSTQGYNRNQAEAAVSKGLAMSVSVTLPFNIIIGFELYYWILKFLG